ncbi:MscL family protein [Streptomyces sp. NBC_01387]|uniref:MscL family protein n=1 Tax=unclassified Streptomyces TaxID=2593676 RepID=UPI002024B643|nr:MULTISPECIES: MscL family protein [unclassified Streptomyces]MCX4548929.1 MscL family protein [Streptomyces sp. NBC_01500]WSC20508.1 MscL family protein [Streptomyces sp. NBC_01766]WSV54541.1 MscL family protein [Streptomyces sp. NBC_01014]
MLSGFKDFILRGNVISLAIGLAVGSAFTAVVTALSTAFITPLIGLATSSTMGDFSKAEFTVEGAHFRYGLLINAGVAFLVTAAVLYFGVVVPLAKIQARFTSDKPVDIKAAQRDCPFCYTEIPAIASRCGHCTSQIKPVPEALELAKIPAQG